VIGGISNWNLFSPMGFVSAVIFFICMLAETNRPPFDLPEAENELVAGYHTEYNTKRWGLFMMAEYMAMFVFSMIFATVFLGGYHLPIRWEGLGLDGIAKLENTYGFGMAVMFFKGVVGLTVYIWIRATFPRLRYDQLMNLGWKFLLPVATANLVITATWIFVSRVYGNAPAWGVALLCYACLLAWWGTSRSKQRQDKQMAPRDVDMVISPRRTVEVVSNKSEVISS
jgi:NADH-quinone oxidoreductase subunit H